MAFPSVLSTFARPNPTDRLNSPSHSALHNTVSSALGQVEAVVGVDGISSVVGTMMYDLRSPASKGGGHVQGAAFGGTGQTNYTKGDVLVAQSASVLTKLAVGADGLALVANSNAALGINWGSGNVKPTTRIYGYSSSIITWTKPATLSYVLVEVVAGGGGGGGIDSNEPSGAAGGGGGGYSRKIIPASLLGTTEPILIGRGGTGGSSGTGTSSVGGTTGFGTGSILYATGGGLVVGDGSSANYATPGAGGFGFNGDLNLQGAPGDSGGRAPTSGHAIPAGKGGASFFGGGGLGKAGGQAGVDSSGGTGNVPGSGGGGASGDTSHGALTGGDGAHGTVIVSEY